MRSKSCHCDSDSYVVCGLFFCSVVPQLNQPASSCVDSSASGVKFSLSSAVGDTLDCEEVIEKV